MNLDRVIAVRNNKTVYQDGDTCIKVFTGRVAAADVLREAANQAAARDAGLPVPEVLLGGDHAKIRDWRRRQALLATLRARPDLFASAPMTDRERLWALDAAKEE